MDKTEEINELISKFLCGEASPEEAMYLEDWKNEFPKNKIYYEQCELLFFNTENNSTSSIDTKKRWEKVKLQIDSNSKVKPLYSKKIFQIAASFALLICLGAALNYLLKKDKRETSYSADVEERLVTLSDGTIVTIAPKSTVVLDKNFNNTSRMLHLNGDAYFSVIHQEEKPFIINTGGVYIKDIGTKFSIRSSADTDTVFVHVDEGIVLLFDTLGASIEIRANENALYIKSTKTIVSDKESSNQKINLNFSNTTLANVVSKLNEVYHSSIVIENNSIKDCTITTQFDQENLETILSVIVETLGLKYEKTATGYLIKGQSCQAK